MGAFIGLLGTAAVIVGLINLFRPVQRLGIHTRKAGAIVLAVGVVLFAAGVALTPEEEPAQQTAVATPAPAQADTQPRTRESEPEPVIPLEEQELTEDVVRELAGMKDIAEVKVLGLEGERIVHVYYPLGSVWDEDHGLRRAADLALDVFEGVFRHPEVVEVVTYAQGEFTDQYGKTTTENAVRITWSRETADQVDWDGFRKLAAGEPERVYNLAESYAFHAGFYRGIENKRGLSVTGGK
ncbi:hypothetical protein [Symbiobacterium terraclitae]|uniref:hypothetical protein n=1 Tax=Symbiobacterium terraclitae TaxID=557451 RepID=UPI0035B52911